MAHWTDKLVALNACSEALDWAKLQPDAQTAWVSCKRTDWMLWLLQNTPYNPAVVRIAQDVALYTCDIAESVLDLTAEDPVLLMSTQLCLIAARELAEDPTSDARAASDARTAARYARTAASYASDAASYASAASYAASAASYATSYAVHAVHAASYARDAASYARDAANYASDAASYASAARAPHAARAARADSYAVSDAVRDIIRKHIPQSPI